ncbi:MAG: precorrin-4 C(11)-methyltransferase [Desulfosalsimonadaceae bacterium]|nr:precorrin-4 C(11)-methyltransferase [Desulfosalsimonadaceae bacterium]
MKVYFVGAGPGDPDLLTVKALRLLQFCRCCVWAGSLVNPALLDLLPEDAETHDSSGMTLEETTRVMVRAWRQNKRVVRLHTGDPSIFGALAEQMNRLDDMKIPYEVVPGVSSFQAAAAALKIELTVPEISQAVVLGRVSGRTSVPEEQSLERLAAARSTLCLFLSVGEIGEICRRLSAFYGETCPAAVVYKASWKDQKIIRSTLRELPVRVLDSGITRTALIMVGQALERRGGQVSRLYDPGFSHGYREVR